MSRLEQIAALVREELAGLPDEAHDPAQGIPLQVTPYGADEVIGAIEALLSTWVTMGARVRAFEAEWAAWCGARHGVMVNSGSSANLLALAGLVETGALQPGDEVLVPAVAWSTSLFPVAQVGLRPVLVDVDPHTLCLDPAQAAAALGPRTRAALLVHLLGQPCDPRPFAALGLQVIEDACAAPGAEVGGRRVGAQGQVGTFSFFFSHHITTIEGGIAVTDDAALADALRGLRAHGWVRERGDRAALEAQSPEIDPRFLFTSAGYNLRPTELNAAFGLRQLGRLGPWLDRRRVGHAAFCAALAPLAGAVQVFPERPGERHAAMAFALLLAPGLDRARLAAHLESRGIATRPISGSNLARQPAFARVAGARLGGPLPVSDAVHERGLFVGMSHAFGPGHATLLAATLAEALHVQGWTPP